MQFEPCRAKMSNPVLGAIRRRQLVTLTHPLRRPLRCLCHGHGRDTGIGRVVEIRPRHEVEHRSTQPQIPIPCSIPISQSQNRSAPWCNVSMITPSAASNCFVVSTHGFLRFSCVSSWRHRKPAAAAAAIDNPDSHFVRENPQLPHVFHVTVRTWQGVGVHSLAATMIPWAVAPGGWTFPLRGQGVIVCM